MTVSDTYALMPLLILGGGSVLVLLTGAFWPGGYLYELAGALIVASGIWGLALPADAILAGITITPLVRFFVLLVDGAGLIALLLAAGHNRRRGITGEEFPATLLFALATMGAAAAATNLLMLFLGLEAFTFAFYILVSVERDSVRGGEAGMKYLLNGTLSASILAMGMALVYCCTGTLDLAHLTTLAETVAREPLFRAGLALMLLGLAFKLSLVPAHLWTPDVYQGAPAPVTALLSTASKGAAVAALLVLLPVFLLWHGSRDLLWCLAFATMVCGNLATLAQTNVKRLLAWSSVAQMGYVALALAAAPGGGARAAVAYIVAYGAAGLAAFGVVTVLLDRADRDAIEAYRGLGHRHPLAGALLAVALFSLAGIPPTAGFMAKFTVFVAAVQSGEIVLALAGVLSALVGVFVYLRLVATLYMEPVCQPETPARPLAVPELLALGLPTLATLFLGVCPTPLLDLLARIVP